MDQDINSLGHHTDRWNPPILMQAILQNTAAGVFLVHKAVDPQAYAELSYVTEEGVIDSISIMRHVGPNRQGKR